MNVKKRPSPKDFAAMCEAKCNNKTDIAAALGISRTTLNKWMDESEELQQIYDEQEEANIDFAESQLRKKMTGVLVKNGANPVYEQPPSDTAIIFFLKTKGKQRGYVEKQQFEHQGAVPVINEHHPKE